MDKAITSGKKYGPKNEELGQISISAIETGQDLGTTTNIGGGFEANDLQNAQERLWANMNMTDLVLKQNG